MPQVRKETSKWRWQVLTLSHGVWEARWSKEGMRSQGTWVRVKKDKKAAAMKADQNEKTDCVYMWERKPRSERQILDTDVTSALLCAVVSCLHPSQ